MIKENTAEDQESEERLREIVNHLNKGEQELPIIRSPVEVTTGDADTDIELHKLALAMGILPGLIKLAGDEEARLKQRYYQKKFELSESITKEDLEAIGLVRSSKLEYIKSMISKDRQYWEQMTNKRKFFEDTRHSYEHIVNIYKKTRLIPGP